MANKCGDCKCFNGGENCTGVRTECDKGYFVLGDYTGYKCFEPKRAPVTSEEISETVFEKAVRHYCTKVADTIVEKNRKYGDSYRAVRQECKERYGDPTIPLFIHTFEKERRLKNQDNDDEDAAFDRIGYLILEAVCKELDD